MLRLSLFVVALGGLTGCQWWPNGCVVGDEQSLLRVVQAPPDAIPLDIYWARFPWGDTGMNDELWHSVQEDRVPLEVRRRLTENGLRAGVISGTPPAALTKLLAGDSPIVDETTAPANLKLIEVPRVVRHLVHLQPGKIKQEEATELAEEITLQLTRAGESASETFAQARGAYALVAAPAGLSRVRIEVTPEVVHGEPRLKWSQPQPGVMVQSVAQDKEVFDELHIYTELAAGEILVVMSQPDARGRLGGFLHIVDDGGERQQRVLLVRASQVRPTELAPMSLADLRDAR